MFALSYIRIAVITAVLAAIITTAWKVHHSIFQAGYNERDGEAKAELAIHVAAALKESEAARAREQFLQGKAAKVNNDLQIQKSLRIASDKRTTNSLQRFEALLASTNAATGNSNTATTGGVDGADPRETIIRECTRNVVALDSAYGKLADKATALQLYTSSMRLTP